MPFGTMSGVGPTNEVCIRRMSRSPCARAILRGGKGRHILKYRDLSPWAVQKRLNRSRCRLGYGRRWAEEACRWAHWRNLANTIEPSMCGGDAAFSWNYVDQLFLFLARAYLRRLCGRGVQLIGCASVCLCVRTITFQLNDLWGRYIWHCGSAPRYLDRLCWPWSLFKVQGHSWKMFHLGLEVKVKLRKPCSYVVVPLF